VAELQGEKIDIIPWSGDPATFVVNALAPAEVSKVVLDEDAHKIEVVVPDEQLSLAIGRRGQNVRLASMLTGWEIDILTEQVESERRQAEFKSRSENFINALDVEDVIAHLLVTEGFTNVEEVAFVPIDELASIEGFDEGIATELQRRARTYLEAENERLTQQARDLGVQDGLIGVTGLTPAMLVTLGERGIKSLEDFADLASHELSDPAEGILREYEISESDANDIIMRARVAAGWFTEEELAATRAAEAARREAAAAAAAEAGAAAPQQ
jgi:N utilization substance protein A